MQSAQGESFSWASLTGVSGQVRCTFQSGDSHQQSVLSHLRLHSTILKRNFLDCCIPTNRIGGLLFTFLFCCIGTCATVLPSYLIPLWYMLLFYFLLMFFYILFTKLNAFGVQIWRCCTHIIYGCKYWKMVFVGGGYLHHNNIQCWK